MAPKTDTPEAPPPADEETFEVSLTADDGDTPKDSETESPVEFADEGEAEAAGEKDTTPASKAAAKPAEAAEPPAPKAAKKPAEKPAEPLSPAAREERAKRKLYATKWAAALTERDAALAEIDRLRTTTTGQPRTAALKEHFEQLKQQAEGAESMGKLMEITIQEMDRRDRVWEQHVAQIRYEQALQQSQMNARMRHPDYDAVLTKAGIYEATALDPATGQYRDGELVRRIYLTRDGKLRADPAEEAYQLAVGRLEYEAGLRGEDGGEDSARTGKRAAAAAAAAADDDETGEEPEAKPAAAKKKPAAAAAPAASEAEAERRGAQKVLDVVARNSSRPKGIGALRSAGPPGQSRLTRTQLDELMEREPDTYLRLCRQNPALERWHLGG